MIKHRLTLEEAKKHKEYLFYSNSEFTLEDIKSTISDEETAKAIEGAIIYSIDFKNVFIEVSLTYLNESECIFGFYQSVKFTNELAMGYYAPDGIAVVDFYQKKRPITDLDRIEDILFKELMNFTERENFHWDRIN